MRTTLQCEWADCVNRATRERMDLGGTLWKTCEKHFLNGKAKGYWWRSRIRRKKVT